MIVEEGSDSETERVEWVPNWEVQLLPEPQVKPMKS